jgi:dihydroxyacetone kinase-like protein
LYVYGNYSGDVINFDMAAEMASMDGIEVRTVLGADDVASAPRTETDKRRGVAGIFYLYKCAGAAAHESAPLHEVERIARKAAASVRTMGVALTPCIVPQVGTPGFTLGDREMEIGMGIHGERGIRRGSLLSADQIVDEMLPAILEDLPLERGDSVSVLVNGLGATPKEELYILFRRVHEGLGERGICVFNNYIGEFATSMEMAGASLSLLKLDAELTRLLSAPAHTPFFCQRALR